MRTPVVLTIAGSDSGGGAGIQADLKAFARCGVHGACAITAVTAQSTVGVSAVVELSPEAVGAQARAVIEDIGVDAVKIGMLASQPIVSAVCGVLAELAPSLPVVVDPVMVAESGAPLLAPAAAEAMVREILPRATVVTPNLPEARVLAGLGAGAGATELLDAVLALGPGAVLLTGGHREAAVDLLLERGDSEPLELAGERHPDGASHGSGCTHSSVLAAQLALGRPLREAARTARELAGEAVRNGLRELGHGPGPVDVVGLARVRSG